MRPFIHWPVAFALALQPVIATADQSYFRLGASQTLSPNVPPGHDSPGSPGTLLITGPTTITGAVGENLSDLYSVTGATTTVNWSATGLPPGIGISNGILSGVPSATGTFAFTLTASDLRDFPYSLDVTAIIGPSPVPLTASGVPLTLHVMSYGASSAPSETGVLGVATWSATSMPPGMNVDSTTGVISGTPTAAGAYPVRLTVTDSFGAVSASTTETITVLAAPSISVSAPTSAEVGVATTIPASIANAVAPSLWSVSSGAPPSGMTLDVSTGTVSGAPAAAGSYSYVLSAVDSLGATAYSGAVSFNVASISAVFNSGAAIYMLDQDLPLTATVAASATGGSGGYAWAVTSGAFPPGLSFDPTTATLSGTPTVSGVYSVTLNATDSLGGVGATASKSFTVNPPVTVASVADMTIHAGLATSVSLSASGGAQFPPEQSISLYHWSLASGSLPVGMTVSSSGILSGTPSTPGSYTASVTAVDRLGQIAASNSFAINVEGVYSVTAPANAAIALGATPSTSFAPIVGNGYGSLTYALASGTPPTGLTFDTSTGEFTGVATQNGVFAFTVTATDSLGASATTSSYSLTVADGISVASLPAITDYDVGAPVNAAPPTVSNAYGAVTWSVYGGTLPIGLTLDPTTGIISGTPTTVRNGAYYGLQVTDGYGTIVSAGTTHFYVNSALSLGSIGNVVAHAGVTVSVVGNPSNGTNPVSWTLNGSPPAGMTFNSSTGTLSGAPTAGATSLSMTATDAVGGTATTNAFSVTVDPALAVTAPISVSVSNGHAASQTIASASNVIGTASWKLINGATDISSSLSSLCGGLNFSTSANTITGTASGACNLTNLTVKATDSSDGSTATSSIFSVAITLGAPVISDDYGAYNFPIYGGATTASTLTTPNFGGGGTSPYTWSLASGTLPSGVTLNASNGKLTLAAGGVPTVSSLASYPITLMVTDSTGAISAPSNQITLQDAPPIGVSYTYPGQTTANLIQVRSGARINVPAAFTTSPLSAAGGYHYNGLASGSSGNGWVSGGNSLSIWVQPGSTGTATYNLDFSDGNGVWGPDTIVPVTVHSVGSLSTSQGNQVVGASAGSTAGPPSVSNLVGTPTWSMKSGYSLEAGLTLDPATGIITNDGTAASQNATSGLTVTDSFDGAQASCTYNLRIQ